MQHWFRTDLKVDCLENWLPKWLPEVAIFNKDLNRERTFNCSDNRYSAARHIWDRRDDKGLMGATASVPAPAYLDLYEETADCEPLAWWARDHLPEYAEVTFFPWQCVFNIRWYQGEADQAIYEDAGPNMGDDRLITKKGMPNFDRDHRDRYRVLEDIARA